MLKKIGVYAFLILAAFLSLFPFYFMFVSGTNTNAEILAAPPKLMPGSMLSHNFSWKRWIFSGLLSTRCLSLSCSQCWP